MAGDERFGILKKAYGIAKKATEPATEFEQGMANASDEMQGLKNLKQRALGVDIPQDKRENTPKQLKPYKSEYINKPGSNLESMTRADEHIGRMNDAVRQRQMQELEDLEMMGAFDEDPNSDVQTKIRNLKALLGK